jgi:hypothetical protein
VGARAARCGTARCCTCLCTAQDSGALATSAARVGLCFIAGAGMGPWSVFRGFVLGPGWVGGGVGGWGGGWGGGTELAQAPRAAATRCSKTCMKLSRVPQPCSPLPATAAEGLHGRGALAPGFGRRRRPPFSDCAVRSPGVCQRVRACACVRTSAGWWAHPKPRPTHVVAGRVVAADQATGNAHVHALLLIPCVGELGGGGSRGGTASPRVSLLFLFLLHWCTH